MGLEERIKRIEGLLLISCKEALNVAECALLLGVTEGRVRHLTSQKELPYYKQGKSVYFRKSEIEDWMLKERVPTNEELIEKASKITKCKNKRL